MLTKYPPIEPLDTNNGMSMADLHVPPHQLMMNPIINVLKQLGGSATIEELNSMVVERMKFSDDQLSVPHNPDKGSLTEIEYRLAWARTYLKKFGVLENSSRGIWALTAKGRETEEVDPQVVRRFVAEQSRLQRESNTSIEVDDQDDLDIAESWRDQLMATMLAMSPDAFERLTQRILRESGFLHVEVTGRSGDGGIDGKGIIRIGGLLSFHVIFQCKRYKGSVPANQIRDFRGAMVGRTDKGLFITTGTFTKDAMREATRDGAPPIDLIDGDQLVEKLKELSLGVRTTIVETRQRVVDTLWFESL